MQRLEVKGIPPIQAAKLELKPLTILIGEQASGKSSLAKMVYFFKSIPKNLVILARNASQGSLNGQAIENAIHARFQTFFGAASGFIPGYEIKWLFGLEKTITIAGDPLQVRLSPGNQLLALTETLTHFNQRIFRYRSANDYESADAEEQVLLLQLRAFFEDDQENVFFPDGRNITVAYSTEFLNIFREELRLRTDQILNTTGKTARKDSREIDLFLLRDFISHTDRMMGSLGGLTLAEISTDLPSGIRLLLKTRIDNLLKAEYRYHPDQGEYLRFEDNRTLPLRHASSGQRETIRILQDVVLSLLHQQPVFRVIEEPEAHLFPSGQKHLMEILCLMINGGIEPGRNGLLITTHSPYILSIVNNLIYASQLTDELPGLGEAITREGFPEPLRLCAEMISVYRIQDGRVDSIIDPETGLIGGNLIEDAWNEIQAEFNGLYSLS